MKPVENVPEVSIRTIGRDASSTIIVDQARVSRQHARLIVCSPTSFILEDCGSKHGTYFEDDEQNKIQITRKLIDLKDRVWFADVKMDVRNLVTDAPEESPLSPSLKDSLDFTAEFAALKRVYEEYPILRKACRSREKMIRLWSVVGGSVIGISTVASAGAVGALAMLSSAGLSILIPTLASHLLSTEEKLEVLDKEYRQNYRCPNPNCREPFGNREYELLARQKQCAKCRAIWVH